jgi:hypothetical protein
LDRLLVRVDFVSEVRAPPVLTAAPGAAEEFVPDDAVADDAVPDDVEPADDELADAESDSEPEDVSADATPQP